MKKIKKIIFTFLLTIFGLANFSVFSLASAQEVYDDILGMTTSDRNGGGSLSTAINGGEVVTDAKGADLFYEQVLKLVGYVIDFFIVIGIFIAFIGGYKIMTSDKEESMKEGIRLIVFGIVGIIIMVSARFLAEGLDGLLGNEFVNPVGSSPNGIKFVSALYEKILYPFIKVALYFVIGILFFMMVGKVVAFVTSSDDSAKKKAAGVIIRSVIGILIVMGAKQLVESIMGKQNEVINTNATRIDQQGPGSILNFGSIPLITQVINWVMGLTMLVILVLIIVQGYKMFTKPDDPKNRESLKKTLLYIIIGVLVIGAAYAISSVLVINNVPLDTTSTV